MPTAKEKLVVFMDEHDWKGILCLILIIAGIFIYIFWPKLPPPVNTTQIINDAKAEVTVQFTKQLTDKDMVIKTKEVLIKDYQSRLSVSMEKYQVLSDRYFKLREEIINVKAPTSDKELRDRFIALGYPPLANDKYGPGVICFSTGYSK